MSEWRIFVIEQSWRWHPENCQQKKTRSIRSGTLPSRPNPRRRRRWRWHRNICESKNPILPKMTKSRKQTFRIWSYLSWKIPRPTIQLCQSQARVRFRNTKRTSTWTMSKSSTIWASTAGWCASWGWAPTTFQPGPTATSRRPIRQQQHHTRLNVRLWTGTWVPCEAGVDGFQRVTPHSWGRPWRPVAGGCQTPSTSPDIRQTIRNPSSSKEEVIFIYLYLKMNS